MDTAHLEPDFDPSSVKAADLRGILIQYSVPYPSNAKKADLAQIYEAEIRPRAERMLEERRRVRASSSGIEDHRSRKTTESTTGRLKTSKSSARIIPQDDEDGDAVMMDRLPPSNRTMAASRKAASMNNLAAVASGTTSSRSRRTSASPKPVSGSTATGRGMRRSASIDLVSASEQSAQEEDDADVEEIQAAPLKRGRGRPRKSAPALASGPQGSADQAPLQSRRLFPVVEIPSPAKTSPERAPPVRTAQPPTSPNKGIEVVIPISPRKSVARDSKFEVVIPSPRKSLTTEADSHKRKYDSPADRSDTTRLGRGDEQEANKVVESGFSDYNPFQSGDDATPESREKRKKRRKSSMAAANASMLVDDAGDTDRMDVDDPPIQSGIRKSNTAQSLAQRFSQDASTPQAKPSYRRESVPASATGMSSSRSMPSFPKAATPLDSLTIAPENFRLIARKAEAESKPSTPTAAAAPSSSPRRTSRSLHAPHIQQPTSNAKNDDDQGLLDSLAAEPAFEEESLAPSRREDSADDVVLVSSSSRQKQAPKPPLSNHPAPPEIAKAANQVVSARPKSRSTMSMPVRTGALLLPLLPLLSGVGWYSNYWLGQKHSLGFCDTESSTNHQVQIKQHQLSGPARDLTGNVAFDAFVKDSIVALTPTTCEPCPSHAMCQDGLVKACARDYLLQPNKLAYLFGDGVDVTKSVMPLLLHPKCRPDTDRLIRVAELASQIATSLRQIKGDIICSGEERARLRAAKKDKGGKAEEWSVYGASEDYVKKIVFENRNPLVSEAAFDDLFEEAVKDLISHNEVVFGIDQEGEPWVAAVAADMPLGCRTRRAAYKAAAEHKGSLASLATLLLSALYGRAKYTQKKNIAEQVDELVPIALTLLQQQEQNHHIDKNLTPYPYLAPSQLRDLVLSHEHSPSRRAELWKRVERIVEGNSNVRAMTAEQHGEEMRVWQWIGSAYGIIEDGQSSVPSESNGTASALRRKSYGLAAPRPSLSRPGTPRVSLPDRHITWGEDVKSSSPVNSPSR